ncbi:MAG: serine/threonine-protein kinase [Deltaproteobacteria bacterium]|jgi:serine/threonine protein kinase|nr:serine/threonine-protein kinase [Deltaproteobacteria bacterium]
MNDFPKIESQKTVGTKYKIIELIDTGGSSAVYKTKNIQNQTNYALKLLVKTNKNHDLYQNPRHFKAGAKVLAALEHPNLVNTVDYGIDNKHGPFLVMELLEGETLSSKICNQQQLPVVAVLDFALEAARSIDYIHQQKMFHGDIKPENFFLSQTAAKTTVKLLDFFPRRRIKDWTKLEITPDYLAPEVFSGEDPAPAMDLFALGVVLFEMICAELPRFQNSKKVDIPQSMQENLPEYLLEIIVQLLSFQAQNRFLGFEKLLNYQKPIDNKPKLSKVLQDLEYLSTEYQNRSLQSRTKSTPTPLDEEILQLQQIMVEQNPLPHFLVTEDLQIIYCNHTARAILEHLPPNKKLNLKNTQLCLNFPFIIDDIENSFQSIKISSRQIEFKGRKMSFWSVPVIEKGQVKGVQLILS